MNRKYKFIEHTADIAVEIFGENIEELLKNATIAFCDAFIYPEKLTNIHWRNLILESVLKDLEDEIEKAETALYMWLNELLYLFDAEHFAAIDCEVRVNDSIIGKLKGGKLSNDAVKIEPKAVTLHNFKVSKEECLKAFVVFDI